MPYFRYFHFCKGGSYTDGGNKIATNKVKTNFPTGDLHCNTSVKWIQWVFDMSIGDLILSPMPNKQSEQWNQEHKGQDQDWNCDV